MSSTNVGSGLAGRKFMPALHGLRGCMAMWVLLHHTSPHGTGMMKLGTYGFLGVDAFFLLSGFVLMNAHGGEPLSWRGVGAFLRLRWWRTYPLYLVSVALTLGLYPWLRGGPPELRRVVESLLLLEGWAVPGVGVNGPVWSLGVEWLGYVVFPVLAAGLLRLGPGMRLLLPMALLGGLMLYMQFLGQQSLIAGVPSVLRMAAEFAAGCLLSTIGTPMRGERSLRRGSDLATLGGLAGVAALLWADAPGYVPPFLALLVFGAAGTGRVASMLFAGPVALFLGRVSFSVYITHMLVLESIVHVIGHPTAMMARIGGTLSVVVVSIAVGTVLCLAVEEPVRRWSRLRTVPTSFPKVTSAT